VDWHDRSHGFGPHGPDTHHATSVFDFSKKSVTLCASLATDEIWVSAADYLAPRAGFSTGASSKKSSKREFLGGSHSSQGAVTSEQRLAAPDH
jgi:hypothetical protein